MENNRSFDGENVLCMRVSGVGETMKYFDTCMATTNRAVLLRGLIGL